MKRILLIVSLAMNVTLALIAVRWTNRAFTQAFPVETSEPTDAVPAVNDATTVPPATNTISVVTNHFRWERLESADYQQYAANLRGVGCPERTIRDIIVADVEKVYAAKSAAVPLRAGFWSSGAKRAAAAREQEERQQALEKEKNGLLQQLLGSGCCAYRNEHNDDLIEQAIMRFVIGPVSEDALQKVFVAIVKDEKLSSEITSRANGVMLPEDDEAVSKISRQTQVELKQALTPTQIEEFTARAAAMELADRDLAYFDVTPGELRQLACIRADVFGFNDGKRLNLFGRGRNSDDEDAKYTQRLKEFFGEKRFAEYERAQEPAYRGVVHLSSQHNLPATAAVKIYEIKQLADAGWENLKADGSLADADRVGQSRQLQDSTLAAVRSVLGDTALDEYFKRGNGRWVT